MACVSCGRGFHDECNDCQECHGEADRSVESLSSIGSQGLRGQPVKDADKVTDPYSTGRKRAAVMYPIYKTNPCEWRGKRNCGGGLKPIIGCFQGLQIDRHHGPVKNPLRNEPGNVHRICKSCHNRWHTENDAVYDEAKYSELPHNPESADEIEILANEAKYRMKS